MLRAVGPLKQTDRRRVGRPTSLTAEVAATIIEAMRRRKLFGDRRRAGRRLGVERSKLDLRW